MSLGKQILRGIFGPSSATDEAITRYDGATGKLVQNSGVTIDDDNNMVFPNGSSITVDAIIAASASGLKLFDDGGNGIFVEDGGKVGIGTESPGGKLDVHPGGSQTSGDFVVDTINKKVFVGRLSATPGDSIDEFIVRSRGGIEIFVVDVKNSKVVLGNTIKLGIGEVSVAAFLTVSQSGTSGTDLVHINAADNAGGDLFLVDENGDVGIGTVNPESKLHVKGVIHVADPSLTRYFIEVFSSGGVGFIDSYDSTGNDYQDLVVRADDFIFEGQGTERFRITDSGNVGINETDPQEKLAVAGNIVLPKTAGSGIKIDNTTPTFGWRDLKGKVTQRNTGGSKPTHALYRGTLRQYQFAVGKEEYFTYHIDHDHLPDSDIFLHVHWSHISAAVNGGSITIEYEMSYAKGFNQGAFIAPVGSTFLGIASTVQYQHILSEIQVSAAAPNAASEIDSNDLEPDGIIEARVKILANNMTGAQPAPFIHEADIHYQSTSMGTKQKGPDFYT